MIITEDTELGMDRFLHYHVFEMRNEQAIFNLMDDFESAIAILIHAIESLKMCENQYLKNFG